MFAYRFVAVGQLGRASGSSATWTWQSSQLCRGDGAGMLMVLNSYWHGRRSWGGQGDMSQYFSKYGGVMCFVPLTFWRIY